MIRFVNNELLIDASSLHAGNWPGVNDPPWQISEFFYREIDRHLCEGSDREHAQPCSGKILLNGRGIPVIVRAVAEANRPAHYCYFAFPVKV